jgi:peroxiredoxin
MIKNNIIKYLCLSILVSSFIMIDSNISIAKETSEVSSKSEINKLPSLPILLDFNSEKIDLNKKISEKNTILIFYRGGWCPYCNKQLSDLKKIEKEILDLGFQIIAISPDKPENLKKSIDKHNISYLLVSDSSMEVAKSLNVFFKVDDVTLTKYKLFGIDLNESSGQKHNLLPVPSVYIVDKNGNIKFKHSNPDYTVRLDSQTILDKVKSLSSEK